MQTVKPLTTTQVCRLFVWRFNRECQKSNQLLRHPHRCCMEPPPSMTSSKIDLLVNFWTRVFAKQKRRYCLKPRTSSPKMNIRVHFGLRVCKQTCYCVEPAASMPSSKIDLLVNFWTRVFAVQKRRCCIEPPPSVAVCGETEPAKCVVRCSIVLKIRCNCTG